MREAKERDRMREEEREAKKLRRKENRSRIKEGRERGGKGKGKAMRGNGGVSREEANKAGYTAIQSRTVGQEQQCENRKQFRNVTDRQTERPTDMQGVESRVLD